MAKRIKQRRKIKKPNKHAYKVVPDINHVARYCNRHRVIRDLITQKIIGVRPQAFELRPDIKEKDLSAYWMECPEFKATGLESQFQAVVTALRNKHPNVRLEAAFARLNVGRIMQAGLRRQLSIKVLCKSKKNDPGYTGIFGMPLDNSDKIILAQLADECCVEVRGVSDIA
jgi:hypothetical protein